MDRQSPSKLPALDALAARHSPAEARVHQQLLAALYAASVGGRIATGRRAGQSVLRLGDCIDVEVLEGERAARASAA